MRTLRNILIIAAIMALATRFLGWWAVPVVAALVALWDRRPTATKVAIAAALAWGVLLLLQSLFGSSVVVLGRDVATSLGVPAPVPLVLTLALPAILAASAAGVVAGVRRWRAPAVT
ncbi:MAG TPA: hypothetical protein VH762_14260 [Gemmatimonadaceae bacterium]|jgi:hypothetical protein